MQTMKNLTQCYPALLTATIGFEVWYNKGRGRLMKKRKRKKNKLFRAAIIIFALLIGGVFIVSNNVLQVTAYDLEYYNLPATFDGFKIIQLSDLHSKEFGKDNRKLIKLIEKKSPDIVVMTGDMVNTGDDNFDIFYSTAGQISSRFETYYIVGNHEQNLSKDKLDTLYGTLDDLGVHVLDNDSKTIQRGEERVEIYGLWFNLRYYSDQTNEYVKKHPDEFYFNIEKMDQVIGSKGSPDFSILLTHNPAYFGTYAEWGADLTLSGHIHGGVLRLPFLGGVFSPERTWFPEYDSGEFEIDNRHMIVSRGLGNGSEGVRFLNCSEIGLITLLAK
jgi:predicted MPP superfamily phosphohydrolase